MVRQYRQGDVFLVEIASLPGGLHKKNKILAYGEVTGHKHQFTQKCVQVFEDDEKNQYAQITSPSVLTHEEHKQQMVEPGIYKVVIQREYDLVAGIRKVMD